MLVVYESTATSFDTLGLGVLRDIKSDPLITEELNGSYTLEFEYSMKGFLSEKLIEGNIIKANNQAFRIWNIKKDIETIKVLAKHIFFDLSKNFLDDVAPTNLNAQGALSWILDRTQHNNNFIVNGDCSQIQSARYVEKNVIDAIYNEDNAILKRFGGELELDNYNVYVHSQRGTDTNFSIRYAKNLTGIDFNLDFETVATRICAQGKDDLHLDTKYVDSPLINNYFMPFYKKVEFDIGIDENTTEEQAKEQLLNAVNELFNNGIDIPTISIKVDFIELSKCIEYAKYSNLESCKLGDTVQAIIPILNLNLKTRIVKTVYNCSLKRFVTLELGNTIPNFVSETSKNTQNINKAVEKINPDNILSQAKENATQIINHPFNGNLYIDENSGTLYLLDTTDPNTATSVWKWGLGGLGYSSTGINGTYETAITQDGQIVADFITTGIMQADRIEGFNQLEIKVTDLNTTLVNDYATKLGVSTEIADTKNNIDKEIKETQEIIAAEANRINDISKSISEMSFKFGTKGLSVGTDNDANNSLLDNAGVRVYSYDKLQAIFNHKGTGIEKLIVTGNAQIGYLRFVKSTKDYQKVTKIFHLDQLIENLEDLEV